MIYIKYLSLVSVFWLIFLKIKQYADEKLLSRSQKRVFLTIPFLFFNIFTFFWIKNLILSLLFLIFYFLFLLLFQKFIKYYRQKQLQTYIFTFLTHIILKMKTGLSFRKAFQEEIPLIPYIFIKKFEIIFNIVSFSQQNSTQIKENWLKEFIEVLKTADQQPHLSIQRLENYKNRLKIQNDFRQRSENATQSLKAQIALLSLFYLLLLVFCSINYSWREYYQLYLVSLFLFSLGFYFLLRIRRSFRWKT